MTVTNDNEPPHTLHDWTGDTRPVTFELLGMTLRTAMECIGATIRDMDARLTRRLDDLDARPGPTEPIRFMGEFSANVYRQDTGRHGEARHGEFWAFAGSLYYCRATTSDEPGPESRGWVLVCRAGRDHLHARSDVLDAACATLRRLETRLTRMELLERLRRDA